MSPQNKIRTRSQWRWPEVLATGGMKDLQFFLIITDKARAKGGRKAEGETVSVLWKTKS